MKVPAQVALGLAIVFASVCFWVAYDGFSSLAEMTDPAARADARGFAWFWAFLGAVGLVSGVASWWMVRHDPDDRNPR